MTTTIAIVLDGLVYAAWLFLVAVGLTLVYGVMRILNVAHGSLYALGAYVAAWAVQLWFANRLPAAAGLLLLPLAALLVGVVAGTAIERGVLRFTYGRHELVLLLVTYALFLILEDLVKLVFGVDPYFAYQPYGLLGVVRIGRLPYSLYDLVLIGLAVVVGLSVWLWLEKTRSGRLLLAVIHDREMAMAMGIDVGRLFTVTFAAGATLAALGGALAAPRISVVPGIGVEVIVLAFAVVATGGLGSVPGAMIGSLVVGLVRAVAVHLLPQVELFVIYAVMAAVLAVRPQGLFARAEVRRI